MNLKLKLKNTVEEIKAVKDPAFVDAIIYRTTCELVDANVMGFELLIFMRYLQIELTKMIFTKNGSIEIENFKRALSFMERIDRIFDMKVYHFELN